MSSGNRMRVDAIKQRLLEHGVPDIDFHCDCAQTISFSSCMPCVQNASSYLCVQGLPVLLPENDPIHAFMPDASWLQDLKFVSEKNLGAMLGNTKSTCVGCAFCKCSKLQRAMSQAWAQA